MKLLMILVAVLYLVNARNIQDHSDNDKHRHRRRSRDPYYDYDRYYNDRNDYGRQRDESLNEIVRLLQEISSYIRRPPPPPQIVYVPYPVSFKVPVSCAQNTTKIKVRLPEMEDENMNWGIVPGDNNVDIDSDGSRPINLTPIEPPESYPEMPPVEHGSSQAGMPSTTKAPEKSSRICQAAILICCDYPTEEKKKECFYKYSCFKTYSTGLACNSVVVKKAFEEFINSYGPV